MPLYCSEARTTAAAARLVSATCVERPDATVPNYPRLDDYCVFLPVNIFDFHLTGAGSRTGTFLSLHPPARSRRLCNQPRSQRRGWHHLRKDPGQLPADDKRCCCQNSASGPAASAERPPFLPDTDFSLSFFVRHHKAAAEQRAS